MPQSSSQQPLLSYSHQLLDWPFFFHPNGPFIYPSRFGILLHPQCKFIHPCPDLGKLFLSCSIPLLLVVLPSTACMTFSSHSTCYLSTLLTDLMLSLCNPECSQHFLAILLATSLIASYLQTIITDLPTLCLLLPSLCLKYTNRIIALIPLDVIGTPSLNRSCTTSQSKDRSFNFPSRSGSFDSLLESQSN
jgi:hypothetical protein